MAVNLKAKAAKDLGNSAFQSGDYPKAIGHYTTAIFEDRTNPTFPLNRAAAYLKLGKNQDAERDCTKALELNNKNVKALFRRSQARAGMGKFDESLKDLRDAAKLEPSNEAVKQELSKVSTLVEKGKSKADSKRVPVDVTNTAPSPHRRRVPIKIVEDPNTISVAKPAAATSPAPLPAPPAPPSPAKPSSPVKTAEPAMKEVSSRPIRSSPAPTAPSPPPSIPPSTQPPAPAAPPTFQEAKKVRETTKPSRVGGGVFRASGNNTVFKTRETEGSGPFSASPPPSAPEPPKTKETAAQSGTPKPAAPRAPLVKPPGTLFDLVKAWESSSSPEDRFQLISSIPPKSYPKMFQTSLEPSLLMSIIEMFSSRLDSDPRAADTIWESLDAFTAVPRFDTLLLFLSKNEKELARALWTKLGKEVLEGAWRRVQQS